MSGVRADVIVVAAGGSTRMGGLDKLAVEIGGRPLLAWTLDALVAAPEVTRVVVVTSVERRAAVRDAAWLPGAVIDVVSGGERRQDSVRAGLNRIDRDAKYVAVHDAARPLITPEQIERAFEQCRVHGAAALAQPVNDTLKRADGDLLVVGSVDRHQIYAMQTPQIFERKLIENAYRAVYAENILVTDEVSAVERLGYKIALVLNDDFNFKITYPRDLPVADFILRERAKDRR